MPFPARVVIPKDITITVGGISGSRITIGPISNAPNINIIVGGISGSQITLAGISSE